MPLFKCPNCGGVIMQENKNGIAYVCFDGCNFRLSKLTDDELVDFLRRLRGELDEVEVEAMK